jgi:hypothetical protein
VHGWKRIGVDAILSGEYAISVRTASQVRMGGKAHGILFLTKQAFISVSRPPPARRTARSDSNVTYRLYCVDGLEKTSHITFMALSRKKAATIALDPEDDRLLTRAARERGVSRSEFVRQQLSLVLEQYRRHPKPASAGVIRTLSQFR